MSRSRDKQRRKERGDGFDLKNDKDVEQAEVRRKQTRTAVIVMIAVAIVAVVVLVLNSNLFYRNMTALRVDGQTFSIVDMNFYSAQRGGDFDMAIEGAQRSTILYQRARAIGLTLNEEQQEEVDEIIRIFREDFAEHGAETSSGLIIFMYGRGMNLRTLRERLEFDALARAYEEHFIQSLIDGYTAEEIEAFALENRDNYDRVNFYLYRIPMAGAFAEEDEEVELDPTEALATARTVIEATEEDGEEGFFAALEEATGIPAESLESWIAQSEVRMMVEFETYGDWLLSDSRRAGDVTYFQGEEVVYLVYFLGEDENRHHTNDVRHILISPEDVPWVDENDEPRDPTEVATEEAAALAVARLQAEEILSEWRADGATEERFIELVREYSADYRGEEDPGFYGDIDHNTPFVEEFLEWTIDPARRPGDVEIVETQFGFHIMYFIQQSPLDLRQTLASNDMSREAFADWIEEATAASSWQRTFFARLVG